jgi:hypothetical protein
MTDVSRKDQLLNLVMQIVPSQMKHHAEAEACDLLMEVEELDVLKDFVDQVRYTSGSGLPNAKGFPLVGPTFFPFMI